MLGLIERDELRQEITERAYDEIVATEKFTYRTLVNFVLNESLKGREPARSSTWRAVWTSLVYYWMRFSELVSSVQVALNFHSIIPPLKGAGRRVLPAIFSDKSVSSAFDRVQPNEKEID